MADVTIIQSTKQIVIRQGATTLKVGAISVPSSSLPALAGVSGAALIEEPPGTLLFRRLRQADIDADFAINSFALSDSVEEVGESSPTPAFTASFAPVSPLEALLDDDEASAQKDVTGTPTSFASDETFVKTANNDSVIFTLSVREIAAPPSTQLQATATLFWRPRTFYGFDVDGLSTEGDIEGLANQQLDSNRNITFTVAPGAGQHIYYAFPSSYGTPTFTVDGFEGGFILEAGAVSVTNAFAVTQNYDLWKSVNPNLGSTTVVVT